MAAALGPPAEGCPDKWEDLVDCSLGESWHTSQGLLITSSENMEHFTLCNTMYTSPDEAGSLICCRSWEGGDNKAVLNRRFKTLRPLAIPLD